MFRLILLSILLSSLQYFCVLGFVPQSRISITLSSKLSRHDMKSCYRPTTNNNNNKYNNARNSIQRSVPLNSQLKSSTNDSGASEDNNTDGIRIDPVIRDVATRLRRVNWISWWSQVVLTVISSITLLFARSVLNAFSSAISTTSTGSTVTPSTAPGGFLFAGSGKGFYFY